MTIEEKLKDYILERYASIREFVLIADIKYSTLDSLFKRGLEASSVSNVLKICKTLNISLDELAEGRIVPIKPYTVEIETKDISQILDDTKKRLTHYAGLQLDGKKVDRKTVSTIIQAIDIGEQMAKKE